MKHFFMSCFLVVSGGLYRQKLMGTLPQHAGQEIRLSGFQYYQTFNLVTTVADSLGNFALYHPKDYMDTGIIETQDQSSGIVVFLEKKIVLQVTQLKDLVSLSFSNSPSNTHFGHYAKAQGLYGNAQSAWRYLDSVYSQMNISTQHLIDNLKENDALLNSVANHLFTYLEKRSLLKPLLICR